MSSNSNTYKSPRQQAILQAREIILKTPIFLDTETTGLEKNDEIIEIALVDNEGNLLYQQLFKPTQPVSAGARKVHKISDEMLKSVPTWFAHWNIIRGHLFNKVIGIYNAEFDTRMIQQTNTRYGIRAHNLDTFDVMKLFSMFRGVWDNQRRAYRYFKLEEAALSCGLDIPSLHRSANDALLTRNLLHHIAATDFSTS
jgi:DNA polymerase III subunit epsilon